MKSKIRCASLVTPVLANAATPLKLSLRRFCETSAYSAEVGDEHGRAQHWNKDGIQRDAGEKDRRPGGVQELPADQKSEDDSSERARSRNHPDPHLSSLSETGAAVALPNREGQMCSPLITSKADFRRRINREPAALDSFALWVTSIA